MDQKETKYYWKEVGLVLLGAILASIPNLISTQIQSKTQLKQLILDRRISAIKDYSISHNKFIIDILPRIDKLEKQIDSTASKFSQNPTSIVALNDQVNSDVESVMAQIQSWMADVNSQRVVINALFNTDFPQTMFSPLYGTQKRRSNDQSFEQHLRVIQKSISELKMNLLKEEDEEHVKIRQLVSRIQEF